MTTLPASGYISNAARTEAETKQALEDVRDVVVEMPGGDTGTILTIAGGNVTPPVKVGRIFTIDTEAAAASDDLDHILQTNVPDGALLMLRQANAGRTVVVRHNQGGAGNILLADSANFSVNSTKMWLILQRRGTDWHEVNRVYGDQKAAMLTFLGAAALAGAAFTGLISVTGSSSAFTAAQFKSTNADAVAGPIVDLFRDSASAAPNDQIGKVTFTGRDDGAALQLYAEFAAEIRASGAGSESGRVYMRIPTAATVDDVMTWAPGVAVGLPTGGVPNTPGHLNAIAIFDDNVQLDAAIAASVAEMEAASSITRSSTPGRQHRHPGHPKAWLDLDMTGTLTILSDHGVASASDDGAGLYTPTFDTAFSGLNFTFNHGFLDAVNSTGVYIKAVNASKTTTTIQHRANSNGAATDLEEAHTSYWGDH